MSGHETAPPRRLTPSAKPAQADIQCLADREMIRAMRFLQMAERHMLELSRLTDSPELEDQLEAVAELAGVFERRPEERLRD